METHKNKEYEEMLQAKKLKQVSKLLNVAKQIFCRELSKSEQSVVTDLGHNAFPVPTTPRQKQKLKRTIEFFSETKNERS